MEHTEKWQTVAATEELARQVALVTGGGRGLGRAFAQALANSGAAVAVVARSSDQLAETVAHITAGGGRAMAIPADVSDRQAVAHAVRTIEHQLGAVTLLINNAGISSPLGPLWEVDPDEWWRSIEINLRSTLLCSAAVLPSMIARRYGRIINVASGVGTTAIPYFSAYVTSKTAIIRLTENVAAETRDYGISIFTINPGLVRTAMTEYLVESTDGQKWLPWGSNYFIEGRDIPPAHAIRLVLRLAAGDADILTGRFIGITDDLDQLIEQAVKIEQDQLYTLRLRTLNGEST